MDFKIVNTGNWNLKYKEAIPVYTKPLGIVDGKVWKHDDILTLIETYHNADLRAIQMILDKNEDTGEVKTIELPFIYKVQLLLNKLKDDINNLK